MEIPKSVKIGNSTFAVTPLDEDDVDEYYGKSNTNKEYIFYSCVVEERNIG